MNWKITSLVRSIEPLAVVALFMFAVTGRSFSCSRFGEQSQ